MSEEVPKHVQELALQALCKAFASTGKVVVATEPTDGNPVHVMFVERGEGKPDLRVFLACCLGPRGDEQMCHFNLTRGDKPLPLAAEEMDLLALYIQERCVCLLLTRSECMKLNLMYSPPGSLGVNVPANMWPGSSGCTEFITPAAPFLEPLRLPGWLFEEGDILSPIDGGPMADVRENLWSRAVDFTPLMMKQGDEQLESEGTARAVEKLERALGGTQGEMYDLVREALMHGDSNVPALQQHFRNLAMSL